jgi:hypothetical protein
MSCVACRLQDQYPHSSSRVCRLSYLESPQMTSVAQVVMHKRSDPSALRSGLSAPELRKSIPDLGSCILTLRKTVWKGGHGSASNCAASPALRCLAWRRWIMDGVSMHSALRLQPCGRAHDKTAFSYLLAHRRKTLLFFLRRIAHTYTSRLQTIVNESTGLVVEIREG